MQAPKRRIPLLLLLSVLTLAGCGGCGGLKRFMYEGFGRDDWQKPDEVIAALELAPGDVVADLGSGGGYFTYPLAEAVGPDGRVYAVDVDESLLAYVAGQAEKRELPWIETVLAPEDGLGLPDGSVDLIFLSNVFHHLPEPARYFEKARPTLRAGGRVAVVELLEGGFPKGHATAPEQVVRDMESAGYALERRHEFLERQSFQVFVRQDDAEAR